MKAGSHLTRGVGVLMMERTIRDGNTGIDGGASRTRVCAGLESNVVEEGRAGEVLGGYRTGVMNAVPPADEVQQIVSIKSQRARRQPTDILAIQIAIDPANLPASSLFDHTNRALCVSRGLLRNDTKLHGR